MKPDYIDIHSEFYGVGGKDIGSLMDVDIGTEVILFIIELFFDIYV